MLMTQFDPVASVGGQLLFCKKSELFEPANANPKIVRVELPVLERVTVCAALFAFTLSFPKDRLDADNVIPGEKPEPERGTCWVEGDALSESESAADRAPFDVGSKFTAIVQVELGATPCPASEHVVPPGTRLKSDAFAPEIAIPENCNGKLPLFSTIMLWEPLGVPIASPPNVSDAGVSTATAAAGVPVPLSGMICSEFARLSELSMMSISALKLPTVFGANEIVMMQLELPGTPP